MPDYICDPNRAITIQFTHRAADGTILGLWIPAVIQDKPLRDQVEAGRNIYDSYSATIGVGYVPDFAMRPCIHSALLDRPTGIGATISKATCSQYWRCFQEYIGGYQKYPKKELMARRMEIAPGVFTPSPTEEACIRSAFAKIGGLRDAYNHCGCSEIYPQWPGASEYTSGAIKNNPGKNLYYIIKDSYVEYINRPAPGPHDQVTPTTIPITQVTPTTMPYTQEAEIDPDLAAMLEQLEKAKKGSQTMLLVIGVGVVLALLVLKK